MRHILGNKVVSVTASSENSNYPATNLLDSHPKRQWRAASGIYRADLALSLPYGCTDVMVAGTNAAQATVSVADPNETTWADGYEWGGGDLAEAEDLISDGTFDDGIIWWDDVSTGTGGIAWASNTLKLSRVDDDNVGKAQQTVAGTSGNIYRLTLDNLVDSTTYISVYVNNTLLLAVASGATGTATFRSDGSDLIEIRPTYAGSCYVDNVSCVLEDNEILANGELPSEFAYWTDASTGTGTAGWDSATEAMELVRVDNDNVGKAQQTVDGTSGNIYRLTMDNLAASSVSISVYVNSLLLLSVAAGATGTVTFRSDGSDLVEIRPTSAGTCYVDNVSCLLELNELMANGELPSEFEYWTDASTGTGTAGWESNALKLVRVDNDNVGKAQQTVAGTSGGVCHVSVTNLAASGVSISVYANSVNIMTVSVDSTGTASFLSDGSDLIELRPTSAGTCYADDISVKNDIKLLPNWEFSNDRVWSDQLNGSSGGTVAISGGSLVITQGSNSVWMGASQSFSVTAGSTYALTLVNEYVDTTTCRVNINMGSVDLGSSADTLQEDYTITASGTTTTTYTFTAESSGTAYIALLQGGVATSVLKYNSCILYELTDVAVPYQWANVELAVTSEITQDSDNGVLWVALSSDVRVPCIATITLIGSAGITIYAGAAVAGVAETYGGRNPYYGLEKSQLDYSVKAENSNGSRYYRKRDIVRTFMLMAVMLRADSRHLERFFRDYGEEPTAWRLTDITGNDYIVFGRMDGPPRITDAYPTHSIVEWRVTEMF